MSGTYAISVSGLVKTFGWARALDGLDLLVRTGEGHGFLGPNGAGKAATLRVLLGLLRPDSDKALLLGGNQWRDATELHRRLAYVPGEVMDLLGRLRGGLDPRRRAEPLDRFEPDPRKEGPRLSNGGLAMGSLGEDAGDLLGYSDLAETLSGRRGGAGLVDSFFATILLIMAMIGTVYRDRLGGAVDPTQAFGGDRRARRAAAGNGRLALAVGRSAGPRRHGRRRPRHRWRSPAASFSASSNPQLPDWAMDLSRSTTHPRSPPRTSIPRP